MEALADMGELHANIQEAVRLFPPLILVMRYVRESFSVADSAGRQFVIPKVAPACGSPQASSPSQRRCHTIGLTHSAHPCNFRTSLGPLHSCSAHTCLSIVLCTLVGFIGTCH